MAVKLFVGSLAYGTTSERLREAFARYGVVQAATVMTDRETGRSRGFGFVEMATPEEAEQALAGLNNAALDGRTIRVDKATPRGAPGTGPSFRGPDSRPRPAGAGGPGRGYAPSPFGGGGGDRRPAGMEDSRGGRSFGGPPRGGAGAPPRGGGGAPPARSPGARPARGGPPKRGDRDKKDGPDRKPGGRNTTQRRSEDRGWRSMNEDGGYGRTR